MSKKKITIGCVVLLLLGIIAFRWQERPTDNTGGFYQNGKAGLATEDKEQTGDTGENIDNGKSGKDGENSSKEQAGEGNAVDGNAENAISKKERVVVDDTDYSAYDNTLNAWWFKRNDNHEKSGCQEDFDILQYDAHYTVPVSDKRLYITFDCGYENGYTPDLLDVLKKEEVKAAFFVTQTFIRDNVELTKRMKEEGHLVCNHTVSHPSMPGESVEEQKEELLECETYMKEVTGYEMDLFFRPPKGEYSQQSLQVAKDLGYTTVFWSIAYLDYDVNNQPSKEHVINHFNKYYHPGAIALMHNVSLANHDALQQVIQNLKKEGYSFGTLYDLYKK